MRRIPVDQTRIRLIATGKGIGRAKYAELSDGSRKRVPDQHETDEQGRTIWVVDVMVDDPDADRAEIAAVKVAAWEQPVTSFGDVITFVNLVALPYVVQGTGRVGLSFTADGIANAPSVAKSAAA